MAKPACSQNTTHGTAVCSLQNTTAGQWPVLAHAKAMAVSLSTVRPAGGVLSQLPVQSHLPDVSGAHVDPHFIECLHIETLKHHCEVWRPQAPQVVRKSMNGYFGRLHTANIEKASGHNS